MENLSRKFEGIWIPKELWFDQNLTLQKKIFFIEINSLDNNDGCYASNEYFAKFFGLSNRTPMSLDEIGDYMDLTRERVRQIKEKAIRRLRYNGRASILKKYLAQ